jgi:acyl-CoA thioesterase YciA
LHADFVNLLSSAFSEASPCGGKPEAESDEEEIMALKVVLLCGHMREQPKGELVIQTIAMPQDTNPNGDIFGGWVTSQMDLGSGILAAKTAQARVVTAAMEGMSFLQPVRVGDTVRCYAHVEKIGRTSMTIPVEVWVTRYMTGEELRVTHGVFTLVAVDESGKPIPVKRGSA